MHTPIHIDTNVYVDTRTHTHIHTNTHMRLRLPLAAAEPRPAPAPAPHPWSAGSFGRPSRGPRAHRGLWDMQPLAATSGPGANRMNELDPPLSPHSHTVTHPHSHTAIDRSRNTKFHQQKCMHACFCVAPSSNKSGASIQPATQPTIIYNAYMHIIIHIV